MPPLTAAEKQKLLLQQEIAKLSGAITRHATNPHPSSYHPYRGGSTFPARGGYTARGRGRGRGRGGSSYGLDLRGARASSTGGSATPGAAPSPAGPSRTADTEMEDGEVATPGSSTSDSASKPTHKDTWVKKTSNRGNMSLMTVQKSNKLALRPPPLRRPKVPPQIQQLSSTSEASSDGNESKRVVIDGVIFQFEQGGQKLVRIGELAQPSNAGPSSTPTRSSLSYGGEQYRRTKRGNLISRSRRAEQANKPCRYYTKTGRCDRALTCPYKHDPERLAICHKFLRGACPNTAESCALSHTPTAHNTPSCVYFQTTATCRYGDKCVYPHVRVSADAPVCEAFAREGWCDKPAGTCAELHIWECPEYRARGTCARGAKCGLPHVLRSEAEKKNQAAAAATAAASSKAADEDVNGFEDQTEYIGLPGQVFSESESEDDDDEDEDEEEDEEDEEEASDEQDGSEEDSDGDENEGDVSMADVSMAIGRGFASGKLPQRQTPSMSDDGDEDDEARVLEEV